MSLFNTFPSTEFAPIFRLLDDYDVHRSKNSRSSAIRAFQPKFDVREHKQFYELIGELPGIDQKDINIEFTDTSTILISGHTVHESTSNNKTDRVTEAPHKATVEDAGENGEKTSTEMTTTTNSQNTVATKREEPKVWVSERSVGEFHRTFSFPNHVDQSGVKASMKNGILHITVPKATHQKGRKINIE